MPGATSPHKTSYLITGTTRGLGLMLVQYLTSLPASSRVGRIFATYRKSPTDELQHLANAFSDQVHLIRLDETSNVTAAGQAAAEVAEILGDDEGLDVLINNAGVIIRNVGNIETCSSDDLQDVFQTNVAGVHVVTCAFLPLLRRGTGKKVCNISSTLGSIAMSPGNLFPVTAYKVSKAALNALTVEYSHQLASEGFIFMALSPGWLKTSLGGPHAQLPVQHGAEAVVRIVTQAEKDMNGRFIADDGSFPPW